MSSFLVSFLVLTSLKLCTTSDHRHGKLTKQDGRYRTGSRFITVDWSDSKVDSSCVRVSELFRTEFLDTTINNCQTG
jgi:hypothetical protein